MERGYETCETGLNFLNQTYLRGKKALLLAVSFFSGLIKPPCQNLFLRSLGLINQLIQLSPDNLEIFY